MAKPLLVLAALLGVTHGSHQQYCMEWTNDQANCEAHSDPQDGEQGCRWDDTIGCFNAGCSIFGDENTCETNLQFTECLWIDFEASGNVPQVYLDANDITPGNVCC